MEIPQKPRRSIFIKCPKCRKFVFVGTQGHKGTCSLHLFATIVLISLQRYGICIFALSAKVRIKEIWLYMTKQIFYIHGCLLGFILDPFTRLGALDLLRCSFWLCRAAKLRWGSLHLQINNNDHPGPRYNHGTILPCSHVALVVI